MRPGTPERFSPESCQAERCTAVSQNAPVTVCICVGVQSCGQSGETVINIHVAGEMRGNLKPIAARPSETLPSLPGQLHRVFLLTR